MRLLLILLLAWPAWANQAEPRYYQNPIIHADYADPDAIRVGTNYYLIASSFNEVPGLPLLTSTDLVHWQLAGHALPRNVPDAHYRQVQHGNGVWAPALRFHGGRFWIFYPDPDFGIYVLSATDFRGPWSPPRLLLPGKGIIDPAPFWDDDGRAWLLHGWAKSRAGFNNVLTLREMAPDVSQMLEDEGQLVVDGNRLPGFRTLEGPKLYKKDGYYYIFAPAGGVKKGWQTVFRSRQLQGPYQHRITLAQGNTDINGPHQGAWVTATDGSDWFIHFQDKGPYGRITHLEPMVWRQDWPVMGNEGEPVARHPSPPGPPSTALARGSDHFDKSLALAWQWNANPSEDWARIQAGQLHLKALAGPDNLWQVPNLLLQKFPAQAFGAEVSLMAPAQGVRRAGLLIYGSDYGWVGAEQNAKGPVLVMVLCQKAKQGCREQRWQAPFTGQVARLGVQVNAAAQVQFLANGQPLGPPFTAQPGRWIGARIGLFAQGDGQQEARFDDFSLHF